jgi:hypothetical protein
MSGLKYQTEAAVPIKFADPIKNVITTQLSMYI